MSASLPLPQVPVLTTDRLRLRGWTSSDIKPYAEMLSDEQTARFITRGARPYSPAQTWSEVAFFCGHWVLLGYGMFVVEERASGRFAGRVGPLQPPGWPDLEIAWAIAPWARGRGYATEAAFAATAWTFENVDCERIVSIIHPDNVASIAVAKRVNEERTDAKFAPLGEACDVWELRRSHWQAGKER